MKSNAEHATECYGLAWTIRNLCTPKELTEEQWRSVAAYARQIERRAAQQYKAFEAAP